MKFGIKFAASIGAIAAASVALGAVAVQARQAAPTHPGAKVFDTYCSACHTQPGAPTLESLHMMSGATLSTALTTGKMREQGGVVPFGEMQLLLDWLAAKPPVDDKWLTSNMCTADKAKVSLAGPETFARVGVDFDNTRNMKKGRSGLTTADVSNLEVAWSIGFPLTTSMRSAPVIVGNTLFASGSASGYLFAIDTKSGCFKWAYRAPTQIRTSLSYGQIGKVKALVFADLSGQVQAVNAQTGKLIWSVDGRHDPESILTGAPVLWKDRIIVPVSANDVQRAQNPAFECCKSHGAVVALRASDGKRLWIAHTMEAAKLTGEKNSIGTRLWGPSGAPIWSSPAIDEKTNTLYIGTGENTSFPHTKTSDSIWAIDIKTGKTKWFFQALVPDVWNMSCPRGPNCPASKDAAGNLLSVSKDYDFGAGPLVAKGADGKTVILGGQKSGDVWGINEKGEKIWNQRFGLGSALGGVHWGMASDAGKLYAPIADRAGYGLYALEIGTGKVLWQTRTDPTAGNLTLSAAPLVVDKAVIAATLSGRLVIFNADDGKVTATYNTNQEFKTLNGVPGKGGSVDAQVIAAGDGMLFVGSGYSGFGAPAGNMLIAYKPKK
jgi:polyvinyl alcohol dehydrogenase (cytochrome)